MQEFTSRIVSQEDLDQYPELAERGVKVGDTIKLPASNPEGSLEGWERQEEADGFGRDDEVGLTKNGQSGESITDMENEENGADNISPTQPQESNATSAEAMPESDREMSERRDNPETTGNDSTPGAAPAAGR